MFASQKWHRCKKEWLIQPRIQQTWGQLDENGELIDSDSEEEYTPKNDEKDNDISNEDEFDITFSSFQCKPCKKIFTTLNKLTTHNNKLHKKRKHNDDVISQEYKKTKVDSEGQFSCDHCGKVFSSKWNVARHVKKSCL